MNFVKICCNMYLPFYNRQFQTCKKCISFSTNMSVPCFHGNFSKSQHFPIFPSASLNIIVWFYCCGLTKKKWRSLGFQHIYLGNNSGGRVSILKVKKPKSKSESVFFCFILKVSQSQSVLSIAKNWSCKKLSVFFMYG